MKSSGPKVVINCAECGNTIKKSKESDPCSRCGSDRRIMDIDHGEEIVELNIKVQSIRKIKDPKRTGKSKIRQERLFGDDLEKKSGKWKKKERIIDRENDRYMEKVIDPETGEVEHYCDEPLSKHQGHGSAKNKELTLRKFVKKLKIILRCLSKELLVIPPFLFSCLRRLHFFWRGKK